MKILCVFGKHAYGDPARGEGYEHANFLPAFAELGHEAHLFESFDRSAYADFAAMNRAFLARVDALRPDVIFTVLMHYELWTETLDLARRSSGAVLVNWGTDDSWKYRQFSRFLARHVDLYVTTSHAALEAARREGLENVVLSQWAASGRTLASPLPASACRYPVSFVGSAYGNRRRWIDALAARGIVVECFGHGWPRGAVEARDIPEIVRGSVISLNFGDSGLHFEGLRPYRSRQIKARIFEVPGAGGFLLTERAERLDEYYSPGSEIAVFDSADELESRIRHYMASHEERDRIAHAGHERTRREHTYARRFAALLGGIAPRAPRDRAFEPGELDRLAAGHATGAALRATRALLVAPAAALFSAGAAARARFAASPSSCPGAWRASAPTACAVCRAVCSTRRASVAATPGAQLISIVMPMRDAASTLGAAIASVLVQTHPNWELILSDDGSRDASVAIARRFTDPRIVLAQDGERKGLAARLNESVDRARGAYIARMDADDVCYPERLARQFAYLEAHPEVDLLGTGAMVFSNAGDPLGLFPVRTTHEEICVRPWRGFYLAHPTWMGRSDWFRRYRYDPSASRAQDQDVLLRAYAASRFAALAEPLLGYRQDALALGKILTGRYHFSRSLLRRTATGAPAAPAWRGVAEQAAKALVHTVAIGTGLSRHMLRHRALPFTNDEARRWREVWAEVTGRAAEAQNACAA